MFLTLATTASACETYVSQERYDTKTASLQEKIDKLERDEERLQERINRTRSDQSTDNLRTEKKEVRSENRRLTAIIEGLCVKEEPKIIAEIEEVNTERLELFKLLLELLIASGLR